MNALKRALLWVAAALLVVAACAIFVREPWHGPVIVRFLHHHGFDAGDLPAVVLVAVAVVLARLDLRRRRPG
jgi:hypothetical protein